MRDAEGGTNYEGRLLDNNEAKSNPLPPPTKWRFIFHSFIFIKRQISYPPGAMKDFVPDNTTNERMDEERERKLKWSGTGQMVIVWLVVRSGIIPIQFNFMSIGNLISGWAVSLNFVWLVSCWTNWTNWARVRFRQIFIVIAGQKLEYHHAPPLDSIIFIPSKSKDKHK